MDNVTVEIDIYNESEELDVILPRMVEGYGVTWKVIEMEGPTGWPMVHLTGPREQVRKLLSDSYFTDELETYLVGSLDIG